MPIKLLLISLVFLVTRGAASDARRWTCEELAKRGPAPKYSIQRQESAAGDANVLYLQISADSNMFLSERDVTRKETKTQMSVCGVCFTFYTFCKGWVVGRDPSLYYYSEFLLVRCFYWAVGWSELGF